MNKILITGGAGYIGSHTCVELISAGYKVVVVDNLSNSSPVAIKRVEKIVGVKLPLHKVDLRDKKELRQIFREHQPNAVIHFAGLKAVGESITQPLTYYDNNITGTIVLCEVMSEFDCKVLVFSSSATVYGNPHTLPICEDFPLKPTNPYGRTKYFIEEMMRDLQIADNDWQIALLRYFNPVGAHESGYIGEEPRGNPNNLMPYIGQVAIGQREKLKIFGNDYPTHDGTGVRDYIHVVDLARGHVKAIEALSKIDGVLTVNLGTGQGYSVLEVVHTFERISGRAVPYEIIARRAGDVAECYADSSLAKQLLGWKSEYDLDRMCADTWRWQKNNPLLTKDNL